MIIIKLIKILKMSKDADERFKKATVELQERAKSLDWKKYEEVEEYLNNLKIEYSYQCFGEKRPDGCYRLANFLENIQNKYNEAVEVYKKSCDEYNYGRGCYHYARMKTYGKGCTADLKEAYDYSKKACDLNIYNGCYASGMMELTGNDNVKQNVNDAVKTLEKCCDNGIPEACISLFGIHFNGTKYEEYKNPAKALHYAQRACDLESIAGCVNASVMYKMGDGVPKNDKLSKLYKERAIDLQKESQKNQPGIVFGEEHNKT